MEICDEKYFESNSSETWKTFLCLWFVIPLLVYFCFIIIEYKELPSDSVMNRKSEFDLYLRQLKVFGWSWCCSMQLGPFITLINTSKIIKLFWLILIEFAILSIFYGVDVLEIRSLIRTHEKNLFSWNEITKTSRLASRWKDFLNARLFLILGLFLNIVTTMVFVLASVWWNDTWKYEVKSLTIGILKSTFIEFFNISW